MTYRTAYVALLSILGALIAACGVEADLQEGGVAGTATNTVRDPGGASARTDGADGPEAGDGAEAGAGRFLVGRGIGDITGEAAECGLMGYGRFDQQSAGIHSRLHARAFAIASLDRRQQLLIVVAETTMFFQSVRDAVVARLQLNHPELRRDQILLVATHTHAAPGGYSHHLLYNITTNGFHKDTFDAIVDGTVASAERALADMKPSTLSLAHGELRGASANRSRVAFERNRDDLKQVFPEAIDPQMSNLMVHRDGALVGVINWFGVHATSMSGFNKLISADNKGWAAFTWERQRGVDYLSPEAPALVAAFAQTNAGDMSPNLDLTPVSTPADFARTEANGRRQLAAAQQLAEAAAAPIQGALDSRLIYLDLDKVAVAPRFADGQARHTCAPVVGASMAAGSLEDGPAGEGFFEGDNPFFDKFSQAAYHFDPALRDCQAPKDILINGDVLNKTWPWVQTKLPMQLLRIGQLYLIGYPGEVTIGAAYRVRAEVARVVGQPVENVLMSSYANAYNHYMTTAEEYEAQHYEGGSTLFGRWQNGAVVQTFSTLAEDMVGRRDTALGALPADLWRYQLLRQPGVVMDSAGCDHRFGEVVTQPPATARPGDRVAAVFVGAHPNNDLQRGGTYLEVQRKLGESWVRVSDDHDWATRFEWARRGVAQSRVTVRWDIPVEVTPGTYRLLYRGSSKLAGKLTPFTGTTQPIQVQR